MESVDVKYYNKNTVSAIVYFSLSFKLSDIFLLNQFSQAYGYGWLISLL